MLERVDVFAQRRKDLRRAVNLAAEVVSDLWDEPIPHRIRDLSPGGLFIDTPYPLDVGAELVLELCPPGEPEPVYLFGRVRRVELRRRRDERPGAGMGVELLGTPDHVIESIRDSLVGLPPPLPRKSRTPTNTEMIWVDMLLTWEEELSDQTNVWEVSERLLLDSLEVDPVDYAVALGTLQTTYFEA